ncbi:unnamed protein product [Arctia plantaginis]|uniref:Uncharacterized protein n=1 Tax=Arctia plantaginis TaxID=874455 RepID=A0A8S1AHJ9_ARCPL|nr:unnamed protein product [Arctia plantaginis]CAB3253814.1 unnamed protein product [Arctia plantaginis]
MAGYDPRLSLNVGSVLFYTSDVKKPHWTKTQLSLLRARKYFQSILPPPDFIDTFSDDYVNILLEYVRDAYSNIKREATDLETDSIMTAALSDTLGGYFKAWVLPVAKLDYYGGTISQDNVIKLFQFYSEIKSYLDTDGEGWYVPDDSFINSIPINVAMRPHEQMIDPCGQFAYFEKTQDGVGILLPTVNWNEKSSTLFVPLKNVSLIPMIARDTSNSLVKYYDTAKNCLAEYNPADIEKFDTRFQSWLIKNIIPHLKDEHLYLALGNVLSLLNMTNKHYDNISLIDRSAKHPFLIEPTTKKEVPSKKVTIILIILFLEIMWCIPAVIYLLCSKKKKDCTSNVYLFIDHNKPDKPDKECPLQDNKQNNTKFCRKNTTINPIKINPDCKSIDSEDLETQFPSTVVCRTSTITSALQLGRKKEAYYMEFQGQYPSSHLTRVTGTGSRAYYSYKNQSSEAIGTPPNPHDNKISASKKRSDSPRTVEANHVKALPSQSGFAHSEMNVNSLPKKIYVSKDSKVLITPNNNKSSKNVSRRKTNHSRDQKTVAQNKVENQYYENVVEKKKVKPVKIPSAILKTSDPKCVKKSAASLITTKESATVHIEKEQSNVFYFADTAICPCTGCEHVVSAVQEEISEEVSVKKQLLTDNIVQPIVSSNTEYNIDNKLIEIKSPRPVKEYLMSTRSKKSNIEISDNVTNYFEMSIEEPMTEISLNIGPVQITKEYKRSKIPKLTNSSKLVISRISERIQEALSPIPEVKHKSLIPQPKKKTLDDMALVSPSCGTIAYNQLNETF